MSLAEASQAFPRGARLAVLVKGWPRLSETFIAQELAGLERAGLSFDLVSLRHPTDSRTHPVHQQVTAPVTYLPEYLHQEPWRVLTALRRARRLPGYDAALAAFYDDFRRDRTRNRIRRFGQAAVVATEIGPSVAGFYAHFMHTPGSVARYAGLMTGKPFALSAHARDIWTIPEWEVAEKLADARWIATCTGLNADHLRSLTDRPEKVHRIYHGVDLSRFDPPPERSAAETVTLLSVGRAVEKKGYDVLLQALRRLPPDRPWRFEHIGGGQLSSALKAQASALGLSDRITWHGALTQTEVLAAYRRADVFVLASRIDRNGDRDGLPNVLMEAQSQRLACVATTVSAIPELIADQETGLLVPPEDPDALAAALDRLMTDADLRARLAAAGEQAVRTRFSFEAQIAPLLALFSLTP